MGANAIGVFSSRAQILRSLDERDKSVHISRPGARPPGHATITCKHLLRGCVRRFLLLPVIRHCGQVQAFRREAHRSQGANVDIAVVHGGVELGVAEEEETGQETWRDGPPPPFIYSPPGRRQTAPRHEKAPDTSLTPRGKPGDLQTESEDWKKVHFLRLQVP